jgi:hypothetical protein
MIRQRSVIFFIGQSNPGLSGADKETMEQKDYPRAKTP